MTPSSQAALDFSGLQPRRPVLCDLEAQRLDGVEQLLAAAEALQSGPACPATAGPSTACAGPRRSPGPASPTGWPAPGRSCVGALRPAECASPLRPPPASTPDAHTGECYHGSVGQCQHPASGQPGWPGGYQGGNGSRSGSPALSQTPPHACTQSWDPASTMESSQQHSCHTVSGPGLVEAAGTVGAARALRALLPELASTVEWVAARSPGLRGHEVLIMAALVESQKHYTRMGQLKAALGYVRGQREPWGHY